MPMSNTFTRDPRPRVQYAGDGTRTVFPLPFVVLAADDLLAYVDDAVATGFSITGLGEESGAEVVFAEAPAAGTTITLLRRTEGIRETDFVDGTPFRAAAINAELDRIMLLIQEDREEHGRALRGRPTEAGLDFCLPASAERANKMLGFDSSGQPMAFGLTELPDGGDASGVTVTPSGGTTARTLGEHLAALVNVRDFGAMGDGVTDDAAAFQAAVSAAGARRAPVYVPASANPYLLGTGLVLDGVTLLGDGAGSTLKLAVASGFGLQLTGAGPRLAGVRVLGPGATTWPESAAEVDLGGVALDGVQIAGGASDAALYRVQVAGCFTALVVDGKVKAMVDVAFVFTDAPGLIAENARADVTQVATVQLSGGTNLDLLQPGDLMVLADDIDDVDDLWTSLKATRGGVVHKVTTQTTSTAEVELATATVLPLVEAGDEIRIVGRAGTATVDSVGTSADAAEDTWIRTEDHCRVFAAHNRAPANGIELGGSNAELVQLPAQDGGIRLEQAPVNGALVRFFSFTINPDTAVSFIPDSPFGMVHAFSQSSLGDPIAAVFSYRADGQGFTELLATSQTTSSLVEVMQLTALDGTTGSPGSFTYAANTDGTIHLENRTAGARTVNLFVVGAPL